ncbi:hypothetical protein Vadar_018589 [Vaccinium darrowii]|uniref:Uncharacterized protein n=1 Tax=Vaccinium darrowii TaxID=229202 RepID=A0ACB7YNZ6_9ERIC|nr:hypothetical protein Vadar_018589 [Vaccinium darrowii]
MVAPMVAPAPRGVHPVKYMVAPMVGPAPRGVHPVKYMVAPMRCVLEKSVKRCGEESYTCRASEIEADKLKDWVETDQCIDACGLERTVLGISSDSLLEAHFLQKLCSTQCYDSCPNIVDLYFNLAAGEGVFLPKLCETRGENVRRGLAEIKSSGYVAPRPKGVHPVKYMVAPAPGGVHPVKYVVAPMVAPAPY